jgi:hypothetical protein
MKAYGFTDSPSRHEEDYVISPELGGAPAGPENLWPGPGALPNPKDKVEDRLHKPVSAGMLPLEAAQHGMAADWTKRP